MCGFEHFDIGVVGSLKKGIPAKITFVVGFFEFSKEFFLFDLKLVMPCFGGKVY